MTFKFSADSLHDENTMVVVTLYTVSQLTVTELQKVAKQHGCEVNDNLTVEIGDVTDRYVTIPAGETISAAEWMLSNGNKSSQEFNNLFLGSSVDDINPYMTGIFTDHTIYDRLVGDNAEKYEGCGPHGRVFCPCED